ncbi:MULTISPECIES: 30S ribosomal protein S6e [Ferroplasma]|jgi:small subunit ribosomal protein S6e|uniref:Small ribosomal subunit protein eS6 n=2 Tax=Ferroplasma TaxID=74968 RepID=S0ASR7_FERAC|nr:MULTISPECIES: 30S ribosomal protein S6e [Ferroplasma]MCL4349216.1 30S ribosomal protein S6e [Candidatus Thermoplasmatota archaeon]AGO61089.1 30S ribosomal protein S6e [Ferroplasma acidarmanus Fer1]ARD84067.1 30S ribosomal protein S6e [Ferroplasma acidiphilum]NOL59784.1 30S ribosomal protein S6e [Ferroplasma acidiphilum]WMT52967.1 MAG: 30S ribosomal protein S6e [Ferroplasma acidiphilum]
MVVAVIADRNSGKTYKKDISEDVLGSLAGRKIGEEIDGIFFEMPGYKMKLTGGSANDGFPMKKDLSIMGKKRILITYNKGRKGKNGVRKRVTFRGNTIGSDISQLNLVITQYGTKPLDAKEETEEKGEQ